VTAQLIFLPTPINFNYWYGIGSLLGFLFVNQLITGVLLASFYIPSIDLAFNSVDYLMRDVNLLVFSIFLMALGAAETAMGIVLIVNRKLMCAAIRMIKAQEHNLSSHKFPYNYFVTTYFRSYRYNNDY